MRGASTFLLLLATILGGPLDVHAQDVRDARHWVKACGLSGTANSVVVDVYNDDDATDPTPVLATIPNGDVVRMGTTDCYRVDLAATSTAISYPGAGDPTETHYTLVWRDDASNEVYTTETVHGTVSHSIDWRCARETVVNATATDSARGITSAMVARGTPSYMKIEIDCSLTFTAPTHTLYRVYSYGANGNVIATPSTAAP
jgi:hypothetical protein